MAYGLSTLFICQAHRDKCCGSHVAIDPCQDTKFRSVGLLNIRRADLEDILRFYPASSCEVLPQLCREADRLDFAFIDGKHLFDYVLLDFFYVDKLLKVGGHIVLDDLWLPAIRKVIAFVLKNRPYELMKPTSRENAPRWKRAARVFRRLAQDRPGHLPVNVVPHNVAILRKTGEDNRRSLFHRRF